MSIKDLIEMLSPLIFVVIAIKCFKIGKAIIKWFLIIAAVIWLLVKFGIVVL